MKKNVLLFLFAFILINFHRIDAVINVYGTAKCILHPSSRIINNKISDFNGDWDNFIERYEETKSDPITPADVDHDTCPRDNYATQKLFYNPNTPYTYIQQDTVIQEPIQLFNGFKLAPGVYFFALVGIFMNCPFALHDGTVTLGGDWVLSTSSYMMESDGGGYIDGQGYGIILNCNLTIPDKEYLEFISDTVIEGNNHQLSLKGTATLAVDSNTTLSLRNLILTDIRNIQESPTVISSIIMKAADSRLCLQNVQLALHSDFSFTQGQLFIEDEVIITGTSKFIFESEQAIHIGQNAALIFDFDTTFSYVPRNGLKDRVIMADKTSYLCFNGSTLSAPANNTHNGISLTKGTVLFDNKVTLQNKDDGGNENTTQSKAITFGNGSSTDDVTIKIAAGAIMNIEGYVDYQNTN